MTTLPHLYMEDVRHGLKPPATFTYPTSDGVKTWIPSLSYLLL